MPIRTNRGRAAVYRKLWGWPMRSPKHLVAIVLVVAAVVIAIGIVVPKLAGAGGANHGAGAGTANSSSVTTTDEADPGSSEAGGGPVAGSGDGSATSDLPTRIESPPQHPTSAAPSADALTVAGSWGKAWVHHPKGTTAKTWLDGLRPFTTDEYMVELGTVDPGNIPATKVTGPPVPKQSFTSSVTANVPTDGGTIAITVIKTPQGWRVAYYEQVA